MAIKNIKNRRIRSWLTMIGIFIGILSIVALIGLGEGLRTAITGQFGGFAPDVITITSGSANGAPGTGENVPFSLETINKISNLKEIKVAAGRNIEFGKAEFNDKVAFGITVSIPDGKQRDLIYYAVNLDINKGRFLKDGDLGKVFIGANLANEDVFGKEIRIGKKIKINDNDFEVIGIIEKKGSFMTDGTVFMNDDNFNNVFDNEKNEYSLVAVQYNDEAYTAAEASASIEKLLRKERNVKIGEEDFTISTPENTIDNLNSTLFAVQIFVYIIAGISILVGGIGIMTTMYTTVIERTKEIGIMKAIGATNNTIFTLFFIESGFIGLAGGIIGVSAGIGVAKGLAAIGQLFLGDGLIQAHLTWQLIVGALLFSFILGSTFGTFPALKAAKMRPVDALSYVK